MSEKIIKELSDNNETTSELSFGFTEAAGEIHIEFADGVKAISEEIIQGVGGVEKLKEIAGSLKDVNYSDFVREFNHEVQKQTLNSIGRKFIGSHFSRKML